MTDKTGGSAFPHDDLNVNSALVRASSGMTLRDYFAAKALQGMLAESSPPDECDDLMRQANYPAFCMDFAESAYAMADAMLKAREL